MDFLNISVVNNPCCHPSHLFANNHLVLGLTYRMDTLMDPLTVSITMTSVVLPLFFLLSSHSYWD